MGGAHHTSRLLPSSARRKRDQKKDEKQHRERLGAQRLCEHDAADEADHQNPVLGHARDPPRAELPRDAGDCRDEKGQLQRNQRRCSASQIRPSHHDLAQPFVVDPRLIACEGVRVSRWQAAERDDIHPEPHVAPEVGIRDRERQDGDENRPDHDSRQNNRVDPRQP